MKGNGAPAIIGDTPSLRRAVALAEKFAMTGLPILLVGATGTGKDLLARAIHHWSGRPGPFMDVNCGALPRELVDGLLFGHRRGAFSGAVDGVAGFVEAAGGGTLFLDELCSLPVEAQVKLLRVLEAGEVRRLGETATREVDGRVVAAVREGIHALIRSGTFRMDLYQRVSGVVLDLPPLIERGNDVVVLAEYFAAEHGRLVSREGIEVLKRHRWPGNVRELRAAVQRATFLSGRTELAGATLAEAIDLGGNGNGCEVASREGQREGLLVALRASGWHAGRAAALLRIGRTTLFRRCKDLGISLRTERGALLASANAEYHEFQDGSILDGTLGA
jgi:transcriptional regulator with PAS, ATPase and Fis domain